MTLTKKEEGNLAKGALVGAAVVAGGVAAMALNNKENRDKVGKSLKDMGKKGMELKDKAVKWAKDHPNLDLKEAKRSERNPVKRAAQAVTTG